MYKDYIAQLTEAIMMNGNNDLVILEMKWLGVYDLFHEHLARAQNAPLTEAQKQIGQAVDQTHAEIYQEIYGRLPVREEGRVQSLLVYVRQYNRLYLFQYFWGFNNPSDNGYSSQSVDFSESALQAFNELAGVSGYITIEEKLPIFKNYHLANKKLGGSDYRKYNPLIRVAHNFDEFLRIVERYYKRSE